MEWPLAGEALDGRLAGLGVHARVAYLLNPGREAIIQILEGGDALGLGLEQEPLADVAAQPLLFSATLRAVRPTVDQADAEHRAAAFKRGVRIRGAVVNMQRLRQTAALDGGAQHILTSAGVLVCHPASMDQEPAEVIHKQEEVGTFTTRHPWKRHKWADQHIAHPAFVGSFRFVPPEGARRTGQGRPMQTAAVEVFTDSPLRDGHAVSGFQDRADLSGRASRQFLAQQAGFFQQFRVTTHHTEIGARWWTEPVQTMLAIGADPAIDRHARVGPATAIGMFVGMTGQLAHQVAAFGRGEPRVDRLANRSEPEQGEVFAGISAHEHLVQGDGAIQPAPNARVAGGLLLVPSACPPLIRLQNRHTPGASSPKRARARCQAAPSASRAAASPSVLSQTAAGSRCTATATNAAASAGARN